jgi:hypothetical protein
MLHAILAYMITMALLKTVDPALLEFSRILPVIGGLPLGFVQTGFWAMLMRGTTWALGVPIGLSILGGTAAAVTGGLRWAGFHHTR